VGKTASVTVTVAKNVNPAANFVFSPIDPKAGEPVYFNASSSYDSDGNIVSYDWDFGDGATGSGVLISHTYDRAGTFQVTLVVTDNNQATGVLSKTVTIR
jgi:PKD repeat protein